MSEAARSEEAWWAIKEAFRAACYLRLDGMTQEAAAAMATSVPEAVSNWAATVAEELSADDQRRRLETLFEEEQQRCEDAWVVGDRLGEVVARKVQGVQINDLVALRREVAHLQSELTAVHQELRQLRGEAPAPDPTSAEESSKPRGRKRRMRIAGATGAH